MLKSTKRIQIGALAVLLELLGTISVHAQTPSDVQEEPAFLADLRARTPLSNGLRPLFLHPAKTVPWDLFESGSLTPSSQTEILTQDNFWLPIKVSLTSSSADESADLRALVRKIEKSCKSGELQRSPVEDVKHLQTYLGITQSQLKKAGLLGFFTCVRADGAYFKVAVRGSSLPVQEVFLGAIWGADVSVLTNDVARRALAEINARRDADQQSLTEYAQETKRLRSSLTPGQTVAVRTTDISPALVAEMRQRDRVSGDFMVCALVIEVKKALAQVQIGKEIVFVAADKLFPAGTATDQSGEAVRYNYMGTDKRVPTACLQ